MSSNYDLYGSLAVRRLDKILDLQKEEKNSTNIIYNVSKKIIPIDDLLSSDLKQALVLLITCTREFGKARIDSVTSLEYKDLHEQTESKLVHYITWAQQNHQPLIDEIFKEEAEEEDRKRKERDKAIAGFFSDISRGILQSLRFMATGFLVFAGLTILIVTCIIVACCSK